MEAVCLYVAIGEGGKARGGGGCVHASMNVYIQFGHPPPWTDRESSIFTASVVN